MTHLRLEGITKQFGGFVANDRISLSIERGEIHALLGENGAGKTTLIAILCGLYQPDAGEIYLEGDRLRLESPRRAIARGIGTIHQHFMLVPTLSVAENIILGTRFDLRLDLQAIAQRIGEMAAAHGLEVDPWAIAGELPVGAQQRVEILKALYRDAQVLILDEPTAVLTPQEVAKLEGILRRLAAAGKTILFVSHKLDEVMGFCDRVTVLQRGKVVATKSVADTSREELARLMVGREVLLAPDKSPANPGDPVLEVRELQVRDDRRLPAVNGVSLQLRAGEILGIAGVDGNGQRELADAIAGVRPATSGTILLSGQDITHWTVRQRAQHLKLAYIPEDRHKMGLVLRFSLARNLILKLFYLLPFCRHWVLQTQRIQSHAEAAMSNFDIRAPHANVRVGQLSGGNQQKVVLARELSGEPTAIVAMQPTRGLDVGATEYVQKRLLAERDRGAAILYISTELEEVLAMSDRVAVMFRGSFIDVLEAKQATRERVGLLMSGTQLSTHTDSTPDNKLDNKTDDTSGSRPYVR